MSRSNRFNPLISTPTIYDGDDTQLIQLDTRSRDGTNANAPKSTSFGSSGHTTLPPPLFSWSQESLTPPSLVVYNDSVNKHQSASRLRELIDATGSQVLHAAQHKTSSTQGGMTYEDFAAGLLGENEQFLSSIGESLAFDAASIDFLDQNSNGFNKQPYWFKRGIVVLTTHRILLLSASSSVVNEVVPISLSSSLGKKDEAYEIKSSVGDSKEFYPIDLTAAKTVRFTMAVDSTAKMQVESKVWQCFPCFCFGWSKSWSNGQRAMPFVSANSKRQVVLNLNLPPWSEKATLTMYVGPNVHLDIVKSFVSQLQSRID